MKKYLLILIALAFFFPQKSHAVFSYYRTITVTSTPTVASGTQNDFPVLFSTTANWLKTSSTDATTGRIQNVNGWDVVFTSSTPSVSGSGWSCPSSAHEIERYTSSTGEMVAWFRATTIATSSLYYVCYGDGTISATQEASSSVWNSGYKGVWHLNQTATSTGAYMIDSTSNLNNGSSPSTSFPTASSTGQIDGAFNFDGANSLVDVGSPAVFDNMASMSLSVWAKANTHGESSQGFLLSKNGDFSGTGWNFQTLITNNTIYFAVIHSTTSLSVEASANSSNFAVWNYWVVTWDGSTSASNVHIYKNGAETAYGAQTNAVGSRVTDAANSIIIGNSAGAVRTWDGPIDDTRVSTVIRSADWILTEYNNQNSPSTFYAVGDETAINPVPTTTSLSPGSTSAGGSSFTLTVSGTNFIASSTVNWNGASRSTTFVSSSSLTATISAADIASVGTASVTVVNPSPGGGTSNAQTFTIASPPSPIGVGGTYPRPSMVVNNGATMTDNPRVRIAFHTPPYVTSIALSHSPSFEGAALLPYASVKDWTLCDASCAPGPYTVYARLYRNASLSYDDIQSVILYAPPSLLSSVKHAALPTTGTPAVSSSPPPVSSSASSSQKLFPRSLVRGSRGEDVRTLQRLLLKEGVYPAAVISGYFGALTEAAVERFQERRGIASFGLPGYGTVGPRTQAAFNARIANGTTSPTPITTTSTTATATTATSTTLRANDLPPLTESFWFGKTGESVKTLQRMLAHDPALYPEGLMSGYYGPLTVRAVKRFQEKYGIVSGGDALTTGYGLVGPKTRAKLYELTGGTTASESLLTAPSQSASVQDLQRQLQGLLELLKTLQGMAR